MRLETLTVLILYCLTITVYAGNKNNTAAIAVATNFLPVMKILQQEFEAGTHYKLSIKSGATAKLYAQIVYGAPYHVLLAADSERPEQLEKQSQTVRGSRFIYAIGKLVLYSTQTYSQDNDFKTVLKQTERFNRLAIASPTSSPYGLAAKQVLESLALWGPLRAKMIRAKDVAQTYQFLLRKQAEIGLIAQSQVIAAEQEKTLGKVWAIPESLYKPITQEAVLLKSAREHAAAQAFLEFLKSPAAQAIIIKYGYSIPVLKTNSE